MSNEASPKPELDQDQEPSLKRRQSDDPEDAAVDSKRQRTSPGKNSPAEPRDRADGTEEAKDTPTGDDTRDGAAQDTRKKSSTVDEKQRSKRLFGALLGNLRQPGDRTSKRRQEIESRRKAELQRQDDERLEDRQRRLEQLAEQRKVAQVKVDEENMHRRHRAMLDQANFLQTETEPRLFYRPWDLRDDEEDRIDDQIKDAQEDIDKELDEFNARHGRKRSSVDNNNTHEVEVQGRQSPPEEKVNGNVDTEAETAGDTAEQDQEQTSAKSTSGEESKEADAPDHELSAAPDTTNDQAPKKEGPISNEADDESKEDVDHVPEGDVDAVIY